MYSALTSVQVLYFSTPTEREEFLTKLRTFLVGCGGLNLAPIHSVTEKQIKTTAMTRVTRQATLEAFFSAIFAHVCT